MKTAITTLTFLFLISSCNNDKSVSGNDRTIENKTPGNKDSLSKKEQNKAQPAIDIIYENENIKLYGDTTIDKDKISYAVLKFEPYIGFEDFNVDFVDHKKYAALDLKSNKEADNFRTRLQEGYSADTANFAGHYSFVYWGCGAPCQSSLLIDRKTGKIYDSPGASIGYDFKANSRMLIVNPPEAGGVYEDCSYCKPIIYIFDEKTKTFSQRQIRK